jgi:hypothetical protein
MSPFNDPTTVIYFQNPAYFDLAATSEFARAGDSKRIFEI